MLVLATTQKKTYGIKRMSEYDVETSMDIPADHFNIVIENPIGSDGYGAHAELFNPNDSFRIKNGDKVILDGIADDIDEWWDETGSKIEIDGRDKSMLLLENDAEPRTYNKIKLSALIKKMAGAKFSKINVNQQHDKVINKVVVEVGDSIWDVLSREANKLGLTLWCEPDGKITADTPNYGDEPSYIFSNDQNLKAIRIEGFRKSKRGADIKNEVWVRGQGKKAFTAKYKDPELTQKGYRRRLITEDSEIKNIAQGQKVAKKHIRDRKIGTFEIVLKVHGKHDIKMNKVAYVKDPRTKTNGHYLIVGVRDKKNDNIGHVKIVRLRRRWEGIQ